MCGGHARRKGIKARTWIKGNETKTLVFGFDLFLSCQSGPV